MFLIFTVIDIRFKGAKKNDFPNIFFKDFA
jgi:hypothetical protein